MYIRKLEQEFIENYKNLTPAQVMQKLEKDICTVFPKTFLAELARIVFTKCNSWDKLETKLRSLCEDAERGSQRDFMNTFYSSYIYSIRPDSTKVLALKKRSDKTLGHFTTCPHCWRFVYKHNNKIKKKPYCIFHKTGSKLYQQNRKALQRKDANGLPRLYKLRAEYVEKTSHKLPHTSGNIRFLATMPLEPERYAIAEYDLMEIWPDLPLTKWFIQEKGGDLHSIQSVVNILNPVDRIDPLDKWDENDENGAELVKEKRILLHQIMIRDASLYKLQLCLAEAWLKLLDETPPPKKGGPRPNSGGRRKGAGRPPKKD